MERALRASALNTATFEEISLREAELLAELDELEAALAVEQATSAAMAHSLGQEALRQERGPGEPTLSRVETPGAHLEEEPRTFGSGLVRSLVEELSSGSRVFRIRAASRLIDLLGIDASPILAAALREERDDETLSHLCDLLGSIGDREALAEVARLQESSSPKVRAAATDASLRLAATEDGWEVVLRRGLADPASSVRRRTILAVAALDRDPGPWVAGALDDPDPHVRRLVCVTLGGSSDPSAVSRLLHGLRDPNEGVRMAAAQAAERVAARGMGTPELLARLRTLPANRDIEESRRGKAAPAEPAAAEQAVVEAAAAVEAAPAAETRPAEAAVPTTSENPIATPEPPETWIPFEDIEAVLLASIRGVLPAALAKELGRDEGDVEPALKAYLEEGRIVRRGKKVFLP